MSERQNFNRAKDCVASALAALLVVDRRYGRVRLGAAVKDRPYERAVSARKRSSAEGEGCAGRDHSEPVPPKPFQLVEQAILSKDGLPVPHTRFLTLSRLAPMLGDLVSPFPHFI